MSGWLVAALIVALLVGQPEVALFLGFLALMAFFIEST